MSKNTEKSFDEIHKFYIEKANNLKLPKQFKEVLVEISMSAFADGVLYEQARQTTSKERVER